MALDANVQVLSLNLSFIIVSRRQFIEYHGQTEPIENSCYCISLEKSWVFVGVECDIHGVYLQVEIPNFY